MGFMCVALGLWRRRSDFSASSKRFILTRYHGLSGARYTRGIRKHGHIHWIAKGIRYPYWSVRVDNPFNTPAEMNWPMIKHMLVYEVKYVRSEVGRTSEAYAGAVVASMPQGKLKSLVSCV